MREKFIIKQNNFLKSKEVTGYFHQFYTGYKKEGNPDFINVLKNTFNDKNINELIKAKERVISILMRDIPYIIKENNFYNCICICVPRAKKLDSYVSTQLYFKDAVSIAAKKIKGTIDGTDYIKRVRNTYTTHLSKATRAGKVENDGEEPYEGITIDTCNIEKSKIEGKNIILIDDVYTKNVNVDEDCIQALFESGAKNIIYYSIGYTRRI